MNRRIRCCRRSCAAICWSWCARLQDVRRTGCAAARMVLNHRSAAARTAACAGQPWAVSVFAQACGVAAWAERLCRADSADDCAAAPGTGGRTRRLRIPGVPGEANYLLFSTAQTDLRERLLPRGILIRDCANYIGLGAGYFRVAVKPKKKTPAHGRDQEVLSRRKRSWCRGRVQRREKCVGCGLCRIFKQDGYRVAPLNRRIWRSIRLSQPTGGDGPRSGHAGRSGRHRARCAHEPDFIKADQRLRLASDCKRQGHR